MRYKASRCHEKSHTTLRDENLAEFAVPVHLRTRAYGQRIWPATSGIMRSHLRLGSIQIENSEDQDAAGTGKTQS